MDSVLNLRIFSVAQIAFSDFIDKKSIILQVESSGREFLFCSSLVSFGLMSSKMVSQVTGFGGSLNTSQPLNRLSPKALVFQRIFYPIKKSCYDLGNSPSVRKIINWRWLGYSYSIQQLPNNNLPGFIFNVFAKLLPN